MLHSRFRHPEEVEEYFLEVKEWKMSIPIFNSNSFSLINREIKGVH
jgi:hypothetical protein